MGVPFGRLVRRDLLSDWRTEAAKYSSLVSREMGTAVNATAFIVAVLVPGVLGPIAYAGLKHGRPYPFRVFQPRFAALLRLRPAATVSLRLLRKYSILFAAM